MDYHRASLKLRAKESVRGNTPKTWKVVIIYLFLTSFVSMVVSSFSPKPGLNILQSVLENGQVTQEALQQMILSSAAPTISFAFFFSILVTLFSTVMSYGFCGYCLKTYRRQPSGYGDLFSAFPMAGKVIGSAVMTWVFTFLWSLAIVAGGIALIVLLGMLLMSANAAWAFVLCALVIYGGMLVGVFAITLRYAMVPYLLADKPEIGVFAAIEESKQMMKGQKGRLFVLNLSFIGWNLLSGLILFVAMLLVVLIFSFAAPGFVHDGGFLALMVGGASLVMLLVGFLVTLPISIWLTGYMGAAMAGFYHTISGSVEAESPANDMGAGTPSNGEGTETPAAKRDPAENPPQLPTPPQTPPADQEGWNLPRDDE
ncbi:MAG: DUF975 family protein [Oscillospiraceae bacterium]